MSPVSRGFHRRHQEAEPAGRVPPGQYVTSDFPVLSAGPTPHTALTNWTFSIEGGQTPTRWKGVSLDVLLGAVSYDAPYVLAFCDGGYTTNLPVADLTGGKAWVAFSYNGSALPPEHGGPARLLVPHLYFWKSAKWVRGLRLRDTDAPGFWEMYGYNMYGDPWKEQRYAGD